MNAAVFILALGATLTLGTTVALGAPFGAGEPYGVAAPDDGTKKLCVLSFDKTTREVRVGGSGVISIELLPADGYKVNREAPLSIELDAPAIKFAKKKLGQRDAQDKKSPAPEFKTKFEAEEPGQQTVRVMASFYVCDDKICERQKAETSITIDVKN